MRHQPECQLRREGSSQVPPAMQRRQDETKLISFWTP